jgi:hypothetical protein
MTDGHYRSYAELLEKVQWDKYGVVDGVAKDVRCENCMMHCGYEPTASLGLQAQPGDTWKNIAFNFGPKPVPFRRRPSRRGASMASARATAISRASARSRRRAVVSAFANLWRPVVIFHSSHGQRQSTEH